MFEVNFFASTDLVTQAARRLIAANRRGHLLMNSSCLAKFTLPFYGAYAATKFGARAMHEVLRLETRGSGVRATLVSPGPTDTAMWDLLDPDTRADLPNRDQMLHADDVARAVLFAVTQPPSVTIDELRLSRS